MRKLSFLAILLLAVNWAWAGTRLKGIKIAVENPTGEARPATDVVIPIADLRKIAPDFTLGAILVTTSDAATLEEDAAALVASELPSQVDAIEREGKGDELAFQIDLKPHQTRIVTIHYGEVDRIWRLRSDYPRRTNALFSRKIEGLGWESDRNAFRIYFDRRNAIDMYGKRRPSMQLQMFASPDYIYHDESPEGRDTYRIGAAIGIGAVAAIVDGKVEKVADVNDRQWRILSAGPVRSIVELTYAGWNVGGQSVTLHSRITVWAGEYGFTHAVTADTPVPGVLITGLPLKDGVAVVQSEPSPTTPIAWLATWGEQVVNPGAAESGAVPGSNIGLAIILPTASARSFGQDALNHVVQLKLNAGQAAWYVMAAWDQNQTNRLMATNSGGEMAGPSSIVLPRDGIYTRDAFLTKVKDQAARTAAPVNVSILSTAPAPQPAPGDTLGAHPAKSYTEAIGLMRQEIDRTAAKWEPILSASPANVVTASKGLGFFAEGSNTTGEWKQHEGYSWTGSFWTGELWQMYSRTHEEKYRRWAELWGSRLAGQEMTQTHDVGFLYFYSAAMGFDCTRQQPLRESALKAAARLEQLYNPVTHLISRWEPKGDETIIDTMMNLQVLWWASRETQDPKWREIGVNHALRSAAWLIRPDGSVIQSAHYNPGDNRQEFDLDGGHSASRPQLLRLPNHAAPGELVFTHTHQGYAAHTAWARGTAWGLYGFTVAFAETKDPRLRVTAERIADFALDNLPDDGVPWYDLDDEGVHFRNRDTSAAAILAGGLLRLSELTDDTARAQRYRQGGERIIESLIDRYLTPVNAQDHTPPGVLRHGTSTRPNEGILIYGQYYLLEGLLWLDQHGAKRATTAGN